MKMPSISQTFVAALAVAPLAAGHTWIEQLRNIDKNGSYVGQYGYPRGMVSKTDPGYNGDSMNFQIPANSKGRPFIDNTDLLCHPSQQKQQQSSSKYPRLHTTPGGFIAMRYMENGHVTKPNNQMGKPKMGGTIFVYGTTTPKEGEKLTNVLRWTQDGQGGDKGGRLLAMNNFDDGRCYEVSDSNLSKERVKETPNFALGQAVAGAPGNYPLFCETNVQIPQNVTAGKPYTLYWVWQWNTAPGIDPGLPKGKDEYYTTCIDVDVAAGSVAMAKEATKKFDLGPQQDAMSVAVSAFASRTALITNALQGEVGPIFTGSPSGSRTATSGLAKPTPPVPGRPRPTSGAPFLNSTAPAPTRIPTLSKRPGGKPTSLLGDGPVVTVTDTVFVTVTAEATQPPVSTVKPRASQTVSYKQGAKFRAMFA